MINLNIIDKNIYSIVNIPSVLNTEFNQYQQNYPLVCNSLLYLFMIFVFDCSLRIFFGSKARWFQLHTLLNIIVVFNILPDVIEIFNNPNMGYRLLDNHTASLNILCLHIYHIIGFRNLGFYDYFHHILFIGLGVIPVIFLIKYNQIYLGYLSCSGIPGIIEYSTLSLYKNNIITLSLQKKFNSYVYIYLRLPLCIVGVTMNYYAYINNLVRDNLLITSYINFLLYLNGTFFTQLTVESYYKIKYSTKVKNI